MSNRYILTSILVMAVVTYLIRMLPMAIFRKKIKNRFIQSFLSYVPYSVLAAMTFPAIFSAWRTAAKNRTLPSACAGTVMAVGLAYFDQGLLKVAVGASAAVFLVQLFGL